MKCARYPRERARTVPAPIFQLSLLGRFELIGPDRPIDLTSRKLAALLAFLACSAPQAHSRDKLMTLLWGSHFDAQARQNLRQALTRLRRVLGDDALVSNSESVALQSGMIACDVTRFEALCANGSRNALGEAVTLYGARCSPGPPSRKKPGPSGLAASARDWRASHSMSWSSLVNWNCRRASPRKLLRPPTRRSQSIICARTRIDWRSAHWQQPGAEQMRSSATSILPHF